MTIRPLSARLLLKVPSVVRQLRCTSLATSCRLRIWSMDDQALITLPHRMAGDPPWPRALEVILDDRGQPIMRVELDCPEQDHSKAEATLALVKAILDERIHAELREDEICSELVVSYEHLGFFYDLAAQLGENLDPGAIYGSILQRSAELFGAHHAAAILEHGRPPRHRFAAEGAAEEDPALPSRTSRLRLPLTHDGRWLGTLELLGGRERFSAQDKKILQAAMALAKLADRHAALVQDERDTLEGPVAAFATALEAKHPYRRGHARRVARLARCMGEALGLDEEELSALQLGGLLHDLGMVAAHDALLAKRGSLNALELETIRSHAASGAGIVGQGRHQQAIVKMVRHHHERFDGTGYPDGLSGGSISRGARIIALADAVDAMLSRRTYREELSVREMTVELQACAGTQFDPELVRLFIDRILPSTNFEHYLADLPWVSHRAPGRGSTP